MRAHIIVKPEKLVEARLRAGMTQNMLAKALGLSRVYIATLESGERSPSPVTAKKLIKVLDCSFDDLFKVEGGYVSGASEEHRNQ